MQLPTGKVVDAVKKLPGVSYVLTATTYLGALALGEKELAGWPLVMACAVCAVAYAIGSALDRPLYDGLYGPRKREKLLPYGSRLRVARDRLAVRLFSAEGVTTYLDGVKRKLLADPDIYEKQNEPGLYALASSAAKSSKRWEEKIATWHDASKAARSFLVLSVFFLLVIWVATALPDAVPEALPKALARMGFLGTALPYLAALPVMLVAFLLLRAKHHVLLYELVTKEVRVLSLDGRGRVLVIPEVVIPEVKLP